MLLAPLVRRSWAPRGQTPVFYQRGRHRQKVSIIAALSVSPRRGRVGFYCSLAPHLNVDTSWLVAFLHALARHFRGSVILVWDRWTTHRSVAVRAFLERHPRFSVQLLPAYAPELNPVEKVWGYLKLNPLANLAATNAEELARIAGRHSRRLSRSPHLLRGFIRSCHLFSRL